MDTEWFAEWFDSPYYHILYKNRDEKEAKLFLDRLLDVLQPQPAARMLDLACGKGRYSIYLAEKGYNVTGVDLSVKSIEYARQFENDHLSFYTQDMREPFYINYFDFIFNFFTSFGYFEDDRDHYRTIANMAKGLRKGGTIVLDFLNKNWVEENLKTHREKIINDIQFKMTTEVKNGFIVKKIRFQHRGHNFRFREAVRALTLNDFEDMYKAAGLEIVQLFGDYQLQPFLPKESERLIMVVKKA